MSYSPPHQHQHTCLVSVVGFTAHGNTFESSGNGVGKSCLCSRFCYGGVDDYVSDHPSIMALHEFESQVVSTDHFLYWGPHTLTHATKSSSSSKNVTIKYEVVEHTIFYHDETSQPFPNLRKLTVPQNYAKKIASCPESSRKISYYARDAIGFPDKYRCMPYPSNPSRIPRGFLLVIDLSIKDYQFEYQLTAAETIIYELRKHVVIVAATKRDIANHSSLARLNEWAYKQKLTVIQTSPKEDVNVEEAFRVVAAKVLAKKVKLDDSFLDYAQGSGFRLAYRTKAKRDFKNNLNSFVKSASVSMDQIEKLPVYQTALNVLGKFVADEILATFLLNLRNLELDSCFGADDPEMRTEMLEDFIESNPHFGPHKKTLYTQLNSLINPDQAVYVNETFKMPSSPEEIPKSPQKSPEKYVRLVSKDNTSQQENEVENQRKEEIEEEEIEEEEEEEEQYDGENEGLYEGPKTTTTTTIIAATPDTVNVTVEEVYDKFDNVSENTTQQMNDASMLSLKEKASLLLKRQLPIEVLAVQQPALQSSQQQPHEPEDEYEMPICIRNSNTPPPPVIPSKPKGYQKWKLKTEEVTTTPSSNTVESSQTTSSATPPLLPKPKNYPKWKLKTEQTTTNTPPPPSPKPVRSAVINEEIVSSSSPPTVPNNKPKGYQKWQPTGISNESKDNVVSGTKTPPQVPRKSYEKTSLRKNYEKKEIQQPVGESSPKRVEAPTLQIIEKPSPKSNKRNDNYKPMLPILREKQYQMSISQEGTNTTSTTGESSSPTTTSSTSSSSSVNQHSPPLPVSLTYHAGMTPPSIAKHRLPPAFPSILANNTNTTSTINTSLDIQFKQPRPVSANVTSSLPPSLITAQPSHSPSLGSIAQHQQQPAAMSSPTHSSPSPPPIPPHTVHMLETTEETSPTKKKSSSPSKRRDYFNTILKPFRKGDNSKRSRSLDDSSIPSSTSTIISTRKPLVNMRNRILPPEPNQGPPPTHTAEEYENPEDFLAHHRQPMPLPPDAYSEGPVYPGSPPHLYDDPSAGGNANPQLLNHAWIMSQRLQQERTKTFLDNNTPTPYLVSGHHSARLPRRTQSFQVNYHLKTTNRNFIDDDDTVDEDGYQKTDEIEEIRHTRTIPRKHFSSKTNHKFDDYEYDYPNIRGIRGLSPKRNIMTPPRSGGGHTHRPLTKEESYVNMDFGGGDDYQNSEVIKAMLDSVSPKRVPPRSAHGSYDDMSIYYNLRDRGLFSPPRTPEHKPPPPPPPVVKPKPIVSPKPYSTPPLPPKEKQRSLTMVTDSSTSSGTSPNTKKRGSFPSQESLIDAETGQSKKSVKNLTLPPRNIPRPGFNASEYTPIIN